YEAEADGTLEAILVDEGGTAAVGQAIAQLAGGEGAPAQARAASQPAPATNGDAPIGGRPNATPVARRAALELGISLHGVGGTGPGGRITQADVERAA